MDHQNLHLLKKVVQAVICLIVVLVFVNRGCVHKPQNVFQKVDDNSDEVVGIREYNSAVTENFMKYDSNNDGYITESEFVKHPDKKTSELFNKIDSNKDGKVDLQEFKKAASRRFKIYDRNEDGVIDRTESNSPKPDSTVSPFLIFRF
jgi:hypothetical protein